MVLPRGTHTPTHMPTWGLPLQPDMLVVWEVGRDFVVWFICASSISFLTQDRQFSQYLQCLIKGTNCLFMFSLWDRKIYVKEKVPFLQVLQLVAAHHSSSGFPQYVIANVSTHSLYLRLCESHVAHSSGQDTYGIGLVENSKVRQLSRNFLSESRFKKKKRDLIPRYHFFVSKKLNSVHGS